MPAPKLYPTFEQWEPLRAKFSKIRAKLEKKENCDKLILSLVDEINEYQDLKGRAESMFIRVFGINVEEIRANQIKPAIKTK